MTSHFEESQFRLLDENKALIAERDALKVQVNALRCALNAGFNSTHEHDLDAWEVSTKELLSFSAEQCLNSVKADAIDILGNIMEREFGGHTGSFVRLYVDKLRASN